MQASHSRCAGQLAHTAHWLGSWRTHAGQVLKRRSKALEGMVVSNIELYCALCWANASTLASMQRAANCKPQATSHTPTFCICSMATERPPTLDPVAAAHWHARTPALSPWLHEEVARRMEARLDWIRQPPSAWCHWDPVRGGVAAHALLRQRFADARCQIFETAGHLQSVARETLSPPWWSAGRWGAGRVQFGAPEPRSVQMLWANMALHTAPDPGALIAAWHRAISVDGYLMFSCLGPDTLRELRTLYAERGWPPPSHAFTDMHDWGDMLIDAGFAEPVMDMERITLTFATPERLLRELRELGVNLHVERFPALRGRHWRGALLGAMASGLVAASEPGAEPSGQLSLTFEIVYGHAFKPAPRIPVSGESAVALEDMRNMLRSKPRRP